MSTPVGQLEDRHGDHWKPSPSGEWVRIDPPQVRRSREGLEDGYGPLTSGHTERCIWKRMAAP